MNSEKIYSIKRITEEICTKKILLLILAVVIVLALIINSYIDLENTKKDISYFANINMYVTFETQNDTASEEIKDLLLSSNFKETLFKRQGIKLTDEFSSKLTVQQYPKGDAKYDIQIFCLEKNSNAVERDIAAIKNTGTYLMREIFDVDFTVVSSSCSKVILTDTADINSAVDYNTYVNSRFINSKNIVVWCIMGIFISISLMIIYSIFSMKLRFKSDLESDVVRGCFGRDEKIISDKFLIDLVVNGRRNTDTNAIAVLNLDEEREYKLFIDSIDDYFEKNQTSYETINFKDINFSVDENKNSIYAFSLKEYIASSNKNFIFLDINTIDDIDTINTLIEKPITLYIIIPIGKYSVNKINSMLKNISKESCNNINIILSNLTDKG